MLRAMHTIPTTGMVRLTTKVQRFLNLRLSWTLVSLVYRPVDNALKKKSKLPKVKNVWTVDGRLGGWAATQKQFFDEKVG